MPAEAGPRPGEREAAPGTRRAGVADGPAGIRRARSWAPRVPGDRSALVRCIRASDKRHGPCIGTGRGPVSAQYLPRAGHRYRANLAALTAAPPRRPGPPREHDHGGRCRRRGYARAAPQQTRAAAGSGTVRRGARRGCDEHCSPESARRAGCPSPLAEKFTVPPGGG
ncbi:hypothetical protein HMPREF0591_2849 [Mycobacterium parascrofulaceum ATCC BAA-614]|uniref:Uncharacterized protein n=1 Tax=Mycobacterium parascrofulaceum ATCC BAA-614 TaxID=525368 RepID=D5P9K5_9MYCO|nr:hypothetical protein HMPREF0591_2849 [Mycobacterium parascrofulaceum ATCC BAA-614]